MDIDVQTDYNRNECFAVWIFNSFFSRFLSHFSFRRKFVFLFCFLMLVLFFIFKFLPSLLLLDFRCVYVFLLIAGMFHGLILWWNYKNRLRGLFQNPISRFIKFVNCEYSEGGATSAFTQQNMLFTGPNQTMIPFTSDVSMGVSGAVQGAVRTPPTLWQYPG